MEKRRQESDAKGESIAAPIMRFDLTFDQAARRGLPTRSTNTLRFAGENPAAGVVLFKILMKLSFYQSLPIPRRATSGASYVAEMSQEGQKRPRSL